MLVVIKQKITILDIANRSRVPYHGPVPDDNTRVTTRAAGRRPVKRTIAELFSLFGRIALHYARPIDKCPFSVGPPNSCTNLLYEKRTTNVAFRTKTVADYLVRRKA